MGIREQLNDNRGGSTAALAAVVIIAIGVVIWELMPHTPSISNKAFYSDDDGASYFKDSADKIPPFDHSGKQAVRAVVFKSGSTVFVGYLEKFSDETKKRLEQASASAGQNSQATAMNSMAGMMMQGGRLIKRPGPANQWVNSLSPDGGKVVAVQPPDGNSNYEIVNP